MYIKVEARVHDGNGCYNNDFDCCKWLDPKMGNWWCKLFNSPVKAYEKCSECLKAQKCE
jgi:hypothetical protein